MTVNDLPLLDLFDRLRAAGLPLGVDEYKLMLSTLQAGFGLPDRAALYRLCRAIWTNSLAEESVLEYHFKRVMAQAPAGASFVPETEPEMGPAAAESPLPAQSRTDASLPQVNLGESGPIASDVIIATSDESQVAQVLRRAAPTNRFLLSAEYFPVTERQMKQSWRYLRRSVREGPPVELDVTATIDQIGRQGMLLEPVLVPRRINRAALLLLVDQGKSMVPFHALSHRLADTAARGGRLGRAGIYYFHNCPKDYLYHDAARQQAEPIAEALAPLSGEHTGVLVISDAGAARGHLNLERIAMTEAFLGRLNRQFRRIAWLNPMPESRWIGSTASEIARLVPMFEITRRGLHLAISVLRGRNPPAGGRAR